MNPERESVIDKIVAYIRQYDIDFSELRGLLSLTPPVEPEAEIETQGEEPEVEEIKTVEAETQEITPEEPTTAEIKPEEPEADKILLGEEAPIFNTQQTKKAR